MKRTNMTARPGGASCRGHTREQHWDVFDALPAVLRRAVADAPYNYCPVYARELYLEHGLTLAVEALLEVQPSGAAR